MSGNDRPLVSVIVPYYNGHKFIREAIQSILNQTYSPIEIVVVNDASPNKEDSEYIEKLFTEFGFKLITHSANKGIGATLADAFEASNGELIAELSQDDLYKPKKIEIQVNELKSRNLDAVYTAGDTLYQETGKVEKCNTAKTKHIVESGAAAERLKSKNLSCISIQGLLAKRSVLEKDIVPIWRDYLLDDWPVNIRLFEQYKVGFIEGPLWTGRVHTSNTSKNLWKWLGPQIEVIARMADENQKTEGIGSRLISMARRLLKQKSDAKFIIHMALGGLMLAGSEQEIKRGQKILDTMSKEKKTIIDAKLKLVVRTMNSHYRKSNESFGSVTWNNIGRNINEAAVGEITERLGSIASEFCSLANGLLRKSGDTITAVKLLLSALLIADRADIEEQVIDVFPAEVTKLKFELLEQKHRLLASMRNTRLKYIIKNIFRAPI
jgi:glycosyltransferase involved in cell wall biosynthesis